MSAFGGRRVETHPMLDLCYLHGFVVRENRDDATERYVPFFADQPTPEAEGEAFRKAWAFIRDHRPCALYYYSPYERTTESPLFSELASIARKTVGLAEFVAVGRQVWHKHSK